MESGIMDHEGYVGVIDGREAEIMLKQRGGNCYLIRYSKVHHVFVLSVLSREPFVSSKHYGIDFTTKRNQNEYKIAGKAIKFGTISELLVYYENHRISPETHSIGTVYESPEKIKKKSNDKL